MIEIGKKDKEWLRDNQPDISVMSKHVLCGDFRIKAMMVGDGAIRECQHPASQGAEYFVDDTFQIRVCFAERMPRVYEIGGRFEHAIRDLQNTRINQKKTRRAYVKCRQDLHINSDDTLCLGLPVIVELTMRKHPGVQGFFQYVLAPYFYFQAHTEKYGESPWDGLPHNRELAFLLQVYDDRHNHDRLERELVPVARDYLKGNTLRANSHRLVCFCGTGKQLSRCNPKAFEAHKIIREKAGLINFESAESSAPDKK